MLEGGIATAAVWRDVDALADLSTSGCFVFLPREASDIAIILTARFWVASSLPSDVSEAAIYTYSILDLTMLF